jgi:hypothetical protein
MSNENQNQLFGGNTLTTAIDPAVLSDCAAVLRARKGIPHWSVLILRGRHAIADFAAPKTLATFQRSNDLRLGDLSELQAR